MKRREAKVIEDKTPDLEAAYSLETPDDNRRLYRDWAQTYDSDFAERSGYRSARLTAQAYLEAGGTWPLLDAGCGTGLVAESLPAGAVIDGIDISPEMLEVARSKGRYRDLIEADLTRPIPLPDGSYCGLTSAGTFTHGHVGPEALDELIRLLRPGAVCAICGNDRFLGSADFRKAFASLVGSGVISPPINRKHAIYDPGAEPPEGHENDEGLLVVFHRT